MALLNESFDNLSLFYENSSTVIFKGVRKADGTRVILKSHKSPDEMFRIKHEYDLLHGKEIPGVTGVLDISYNDDKNYLVLEDTGAVVLDDYMDGRQLDTVTLLKIGKSAARALAGIHENGIIHCDVKPANMLVHPETLQVWFIDFGISFSVHSREAQGEGGFAGTLEFMAPEQTGRLNMKVDARSDLYSLGITLYYLLTGHLPFTGESAVEIVHAQTVLAPAPIQEYVAADPMVDSLIMKLMEKAPRRRYQSAQSLEYDIDIILAGMDAGGAVPPFTLGERDVFASLEPGQKLFGKEGIVAEIERLFFTTPKDGSSLILLHGPQDAGKSSVVANYQRFVESNNGYLLHAHFSWTDSGESYTALRDLFEGFELFAYNANLPLPEYRTRILEALGENAQVLIDIIPSFGNILGPQQPVQKLAPRESQERARRVFAKTLEILCDAPYPFVLVFEDVQHADENSLDLLLTAIESKGVGNCIMLLSYNDEDPAFLNRYSPRVQALNRESLVVADIALGYLTPRDVERLVEELFEADPMQSRELAQIIYNATGGVLSKMRQYLQLMYRAKQVQYNADTDTWSIHIDQMDAHVLEDLENRYRETYAGLSTEVQLHLRQFAVLGEQFNISDAVCVFGIDATGLDDTVKAMQQLGWLVADKRNPGSMAFANPSIYEVCLGEIEQSRLLEKRKLVVSKLYEKYKEEPQELLRRSTLFTRQILDAGRQHFPAEVLQDLSRVKLSAAEEIMRAANMGKAASTFANALLLMGDDPFAFNAALAHEVYLQYAMCCFALHEYDKAVELFAVLEGHLLGEDDAYNAYYTIVKQYLANADWENAKDYAKRYLRRYNLLLEEGTDVLAAGDREFERYVALTGQPGVTVVLGYPRTGDALVEHHGNMLALLALALLFNLDEKYKYYLYKAVNFAVEKQEVFSEGIILFCVAAARYAGLQEYERAKAVIEVGFAFAEKNESPTAFLWCIYGNMVSHWVNPLAETVDIYKKAKYHSLMEGNAFYEAFADMMLLNYHSFIGENLEEYHRETQATLHNLERNRLSALQANFITFRQYARCLLGRTAGPDSFDDAQFTEASLEGLRGTWNGIFNENFYYVYRMRALYIHGFYDMALEYAQKYEALAQKVNLSAYITSVQYHYYYCLTLLALCRKYPEKQEEYLAVVRRHQQSLELYATANPTNFEFKNMFVKTIVRSLGSGDIGLVDEYAKEHRGFLGKNLVWDVIFVEQMVRIYWEEHDLPQYVVIHKQNALKHYKEIGAHYMIRQLRDVDETRGKHHKRHTYGTHHAGATHTMATLPSSHMATGITGTIAMGMGSSYYSGINVSLDFASLLSVLEKLIEMDTLPALAGEFAEQLLQNGNAEKVLLFLDTGSVTNLKAARYANEADSEFNTAELPIDITAIEPEVIPKKLVEVVKANGEVTVANSSRDDYHLLGDPYLEKKRPESFLCIPVVAKGRHLGVVYLENATLPGAFPEGRVNFLDSLARQSSVMVLNLQNVAKMEEYTKDLERRLSSYLAQQNALIAGIAHEINSPVGVCLTVATKLYEKTGEVQKAFQNKALGKSALEKYLEEAHDGLNIINNNVMRAGDLMQNFKKMSVEQSTEVFETLELAPTIQSIVEYIRPGVKKKIDTISLDIPEGLRLYSSQGVLAQIFTNLIMNSAIHGFENMEKDSCKASITVTELPNRDEVEIRYSDNGKGLDEEEKEKIFQPFFTTKRNRGGSGLGGHIVLTHVTQTLKGSIQCESEPGEGTTFIIRLPKYEQQQRAEAKEA